MMGTAPDTTLETARLTLRPWCEADAPALFALARDPQVGPRAGWPAHTSVDESRTVIRDVLAGPVSYALCLTGTRADGAPCEVLAGAIALKTQDESDLATSPAEFELGYWCGRAFWDRGYATEAARALLEHGFRDLGAGRVWASFNAGNTRSRRVLEKLGFVCSDIELDVDEPLLGTKTDLVVCYLDAEMWCDGGRGVADRARELLAAQPDPERFLPITEPLKLGRARVVALNERLGVMTRMERGGYFAAPFSPGAARALARYLAPGDLVSIADAELAPVMAPGGAPACYELWAYRHGTAPALDTAALDLKPLGPEAVDIVDARYDLLPREAINDHLERGWIWGGFDAQGALVGFIGEHDEASMGMLEVFPQARRRGYASALEAAQITRFLKAGRVPYCHVAPGNAASQALQEKLGLTRVGPQHCWVEVPA